MARISNTAFIHFNDIYNADKAAPFVSSIKNCRRDLQSSSSEEVDGHRRRRDVFTFFSGDVFSPSILSTFFRGEQMLPVLNALDIDCACLGMYILWCVSWFRIFLWQSYHTYDILYRMNTILWSHRFYISQYQLNRKSWAGLWLGTFLFTFRKV